MVKAVLINDTRVDLHHGCDRVLQSFFLNCAEVGIDILATAPAHADWSKDDVFLRAFESAHLVIVNGEGTIHHDLPAGDLLLNAGKLARQQNKPAALINCTWEANGAEFEKKLMDFSLISVRETLSKNAIAYENITPLLVPDLSLEGLNWQTSQRNKIGFSDSVVRHDLPLLYELLKATPDGISFPIQYPDLGIDGLWRFFRSYIGKSDLLPLKNVSNIISNRFFQWKNHTRVNEEFIRRLANLSLLVSGRFHLTCAAIGIGTPFLALDSNSHKVKGLLMDAGLDSRLVLPSQLNEESMLLAMTWTDTERESIGDYLADATRQRKELFKNLVGLVS